MWKKVEDFITEKGTAMAFSSLIAGDAIIIISALLTVFGIIGIRSFVILLVIAVTPTVILAVLCMIILWKAEKNDAKKESMP